MSPPHQVSTKVPIVSPPPPFLVPLKDIFSTLYPIDTSIAQMDAGDTGTSHWKDSSRAQHPQHPFSQWEFCTLQAVETSSHKPMISKMPGTSN
ncbi:unnamed protein product [Timema podura]|uniref:Uncharacterized protein n=1 Tax=Timema podura TaxID=61482 RepID=A0ABN7P921_TIMPD|nr:unnamed protein product [Timema podura]